MPIRIYAFAKELDLDNKSLLDICAKVGINGKGSALASLTDEEVAKINKHMAGSSVEKKAAPQAATQAKTPAKPEVNERPISPLDRMRSVDRPRVLERPKKSPISGSGLGNLRASGAVADPPPADVAAKKSVESVPQKSVAEKPVSRIDSPIPAAAKSAVPASSSSGPPAAKADSGEATPDSASSDAPPVNERRRTGPLFSRPGPMRNLDSRPKRAGDETPREDREAKPSRGRAPLTRLAAMPKVKQPTASQRQSEEKVVKPDLALPQDAIQKVKRHGNAALPLAAFTDSAKKTKKGGAETASTTSPEESGNADRRRRGKGKADAPVGENVDSGMGSVRQKRDKRPDRRVTTSRFKDDDSPLRFRRRRPKSGSVNNTAAPRKENPVLQLPCTVRTFSEVTGVAAGQVLKALMIDFGLGMSVNINAVLDLETVELLVTQFEASVEIRAEQTLEDSVIRGLDLEDSEEDMVLRPPIVTFLGHVDHGKTSLLDALIGINVVSGEAGGITQHIRAYAVNREGRQVSFVDTPGHEAFTEMRARGANVTDIAVLVVAADDGVMPQTEEAISHAKAAGVPIIVAMNKIDLPGANPDKVLQNLAAHNLMPSQWGGDVEVVQTSAIAGTGLDELLETILTTAELYEYKANPNRSAVGTCLEAEQDPDRGVIAKVMVQNGTLHVGDIVLCGNSYGRVKAMGDTLRVGVRLTEAGPSTPVNITGLDRAPGAGEKFYVVDSIAKAREIAASREGDIRDRSLSGFTKRVSLEEFQTRLEAGDLAGSQKEVVTLNLVLRADARGSIEAIQKELTKLDHPEVRIRILQALVGGITVGDVRLAQASDAVIIGFNVVPDENARSLSEDLQVEIRRYEVIYKVADDIKATLEGKLKPDKQAVELGALMVLRTFNVSRMGTIAGCRVMRGTVQRGSRLRVIRDNRILGDYAMDSLKREKDDAKEVTKGMECGVKLEGFNDVKEGDMLEAYRIEEVARKL